MNIKISNSDTKSMYVISIDDMTIRAVFSDIEVIEYLKKQNNYTLELSLKENDRLITLLKGKGIGND